MENRNTALDGLCGIAIVFVLLEHTNVWGGGWIGVQMFFVLSGYLITSILLTTKSLPGRTYLKRFYWRRTLRILPLYVFFLCFCMLLFFNGQAPYMHTEWPYLVTFTYNFYRAVRPWGTSGIVEHLWSLSVEEQFYILWPIVVYACSHATLKKVALISIIATPLLRYAFMQLYPDQYVNIEYAVTPFQADGFTMGALIALTKPQLHWIKWGVAGWVLGIVGSVLIGYDWWTEPYADGYLWWFYSVWFLGRGLVIIAVTQEQYTFPVLHNSLLAYIGRVSYGIYIWHYPLRNMFFSSPK